MSSERASGTGPNQVLIDATMLLRWQHLAPVGIVRLERLLASHLRFRSQLGPAQFVVWSRGYRPAEPYEVASLDKLLSGETVPQPALTSSLPAPSPATVGGALPAVRRIGLKT